MIWYNMTFRQLKVSQILSGECLGMTLGSEDFILPRNRLYNPFSSVVAYTYTLWRVVVDDNIGQSENLFSVWGAVTVHSSHTWSNGLSPVLPQFYLQFYTPL